MWQRGIIHLVPDDGLIVDQCEAKRNFLKLVAYYQRKMDDPLQAVLCVMAAGILLWRELVLWGPMDGIAYFPMGVLVLELSQPFIGLALGAMAWRLIVIGLFFRSLGNTYELAPQIDHPDKAGGMAVLGSLFLWNSLFFILPGIFISVWYLVLRSFNPKDVQSFFGELDVASLLTRVIIFFLLVGGTLVILSSLAFFWPIYGFHKEMERFRDRIQDKLDALSRTTEALRSELLDHATTLSAKEGSEKLEEIEFQQKLLQQDRKIPTWPFDTQTILKFLAAQAGPVLTLLGVSNSITDLIKSLISQ